MITAVLNRLDILLAHIMPIGSIFSDITGGWKLTEISHEIIPEILSPNDIGDWRSQMFIPTEIFVSQASLILKVNGESDKTIPIDAGSFCADISIQQGELYYYVTQLSILQASSNIVLLVRRYMAVNDPKRAFCEFSHHQYRGIRILNA